MATITKLIPAQQRINDALRSGAQIIYSRGSNTQHGYVAGVKRTAVRYDVFVALRNAAIVKQLHDGFWTRTFGLSDAVAAWADLAPERPHDGCAAEQPKTTTAQFRTCWTCAATRSVCMTTVIDPRVIVMALDDDLDEAVIKEADAALRSALDVDRLDQFLAEHATTVFWAERYDQCPLYAFLADQWHSTPFGVHYVSADGITLTVHGREVDCDTVPELCTLFVDGVDKAGWEHAGQPEAEGMPGEDRPGYPITGAHARAVLHMVLHTPTTALPATSAAG